MAGRVACVGDGVESGTRLKFVHLLLLSTMIVPLTWRPVHAQAPVSNAARYEFNIPSQSVDGALAAFSRVSAFQVLNRGALTRGVISPGVRGRFTAAEALSQLLAGTGLTPHFAGANTVTVTGTTSTSFNAPDGAISLETIEVQGPTYGTTGFVATRSTAGNKSNIPLIEVPAAVSVITRGELDARGVQDINAAMGYTPGIKVIDYPGGQGAPNIYIRGYRTINFLGSYQDGLRAGFNSYDQNLETFGAERIDVIKGPVSALYGQGAPGGVVNMITKRPQFTQSNEIQLQGGTNKWRAATFDLTGPVAGSDQFAYRFTGLIRRADSPVAFSPDDRTYIAPAFTWKPSENTSLTLLANYFDMKRGGSEQSLPISGTMYPNPVGGYLPRQFFLGEPGWNEERIKNTSVAYIFDHAFNESLRVQSTTRFISTESDYKTTGATNSGVLVNNRFYRRNAALREQESQSFLTDNRIEGKFDTWGFRHTMLVGFDYSTYRRDERRRSGTASVLDIFAPVYGRPLTLPAGLSVSTLNKLEQIGVYVQDQIKFQRFILTLGARRDVAESKVTNRLGTNSPTTSRVDQAMSYRAGLGYEFENGVVPYVSYSTSFNPQVAPRADGRPFDPAEGKQFEAGIKYQPSGWNSYISAAVFDIVQTNVPTRDIANPGFFTQAGETRSRGLELEAKASLGNGFGVIASYSYLDAKVTKDNPNPATGISLQGNRLERVPRHSASLWLDYEAQEGSFAGLRLGVGARYTGETTDTTNIDRFPGYTLVDASISYDFSKMDPRLKGLKFTVSGTNLFDTRYFQAGFYQGTVLEGARRTVLGTMSYRF
ncbi:MAG: hypothetical protein BGP04_16730 [Rhizobiales bacterium 62-17]|nr:TonB-dependent siderophore receptor [Hyphomicrobiales bacterium]OJY03381.1 MAG: hypothetical protein BGP04_16730 [Rhizobiales bacterium 62-17]